MQRELNFSDTCLATFEDEEQELQHPPLSHHDRKQAKLTLEAMLFSSPEPVPKEKLREILKEHWPLKRGEFSQILQDLQEDYTREDRPFQLDEIAGGLVLRTKEVYGPFVEKLLGGRRAERLSSAAMEVLAIIAYKQPITRPAIEAIRGVDSSGVVASLLERDLIHAVGKLEAPGRPSLYATTNRFLQHFGLKNATDLPDIV